MICDTPKCGLMKQKEIRFIHLSSFRERWKRKRKLEKWCFSEKLYTHKSALTKFVGGELVESRFTITFAWMLRNGLELFLRMFIGLQESLMRHCLYNIPDLLLRVIIQLKKYGQSREILHRLYLCNLGRYYNSGMRGTNAQSILPRTSRKGNIWI